MISGSNDFFNFNSFNKARKWPACADPVGYSLIISLPFVLDERPLTRSANISLLRCSNWSIGISSKFASIRSAILSSAISIVRYKTFLPWFKLAAAQ